MMNDYYQLDLTERRRLLTEAGFARNDLRVWAHADGRAVGEGVAGALTDAAFCRFLRIEPPAQQSVEDAPMPEPPARTTIVAEQWSMPVYLTGESKR